VAVYGKVLTGLRHIKDYAKTNGIFLPRTGENLVLTGRKQSTIFLVYKLPFFAY